MLLYLSPIISLVDDSITHANSNIELVDLHVVCGSKDEAKIDLTIKVDEQDKKCEFSSKFGPVDAIFGAIKELIPHEATLELYQVNAVTSGTDAQATANVRLKKDGKIFSSSGSSTDVLEASAIAYLNSLEKMTS